MSRSQQSSQILNDCATIIMTSISKVIGNNLKIMLFESKWFTDSVRNMSDSKINMIGTGLFAIFFFEI